MIERGRRLEHREDEKVMFSLRKRAVSIVATMAAAAGLSAVAAPVASASGGYGSCGSGYHRIDTYTLYQSFGPNIGGGGKLLLYYNSSNGNNCLITQATGSSFGRSHQRIMVDLSVSDHWESWDSDSKYRQDDTGSYRYYAGPIYVHAPGKCINVQGSIDDYTPYGTLVASYSRHENPVHCG